MDKPSVYKYDTHLNSQPFLPVSSQWADTNSHQKAEDSKQLRDGSQHYQTCLTVAFSHLKGTMRLGWRQR